MAKEVSEQVRALNRAARKAASGAGKDWASLSQEERKKYRQEARKTMRDNKKTGRGGSGPALGPREQAIKAAQAAGQDWKELSREQRQVYLKRARGAS